MNPVGLNEPDDTTIEITYEMIERLGRIIERMKNVQDRFSTFEERFDNDDAKVLFEEAATFFLRVYQAMIFADTMVL